MFIPKDIKIELLLYDKIQRLFIIILFIFIFFSENHHSNFSNFYNDNKHIPNLKKGFNKWIVTTAFNPPSPFIINLEKKIKDWKIVVVGNNETNDAKWYIFNTSNNLFYLSAFEQNNLNYSIIKYLKKNSCFRKMIGYLYAIQNGAEEIYEIDEDLEFNNTKLLNTHFENAVVSYGIRNDSLMINPYYYFGEPNVWPRGFRIGEIGKQQINKFHHINMRNVDLKPLVFQGLINIIPDVDSIFFLTRRKFNNLYEFNANISRSYPLIYFPYNYVPINSKNTRYLYEIFPFLIFPISLDENIADIWRGYIMQNLAWKQKGIILYYISDAYKNISMKNAFNQINDKNDFCK